MLTAKLDNVCVRFRYEGSQSKKVCLQGLVSLTRCQEKPLVKVESFSCSGDLRGHGERLPVTWSVSEDSPGGHWWRCCPWSPQPVGDARTTQWQQKSVASVEQSWRKESLWSPEDQMATLSHLLGLCFDCNCALTLSSQSKKVYNLFFYFIGVYRWEFLDFKRKVRLLGDGLFSRLRFLKFGMFYDLT